MAVVLLANVFFWGGGKCPNLGVVNVRILGVVNVRLANNLTPCICVFVCVFLHSWPITYMLVAGNMLVKVKVTWNHLELNRGPEYTDLEQFLICGKFIIF